MEKNIDEKQAQNVETTENTETISEVATENNEATIDELQNSLSETSDKLLRVLAEYDNYRKRSQKEKDSIYPQAVSDTVARFIPIIDNFERALEQSCADAEYEKGIKLIYDMLSSILKDLGVEEIGTVGEEFDANLHNAVMHVDDENLGDNVIASIMQKGYKIGDKVVRFATVTVAN
ncbi:MAG: nucleotide exchange factor GrpE [Oscillospiraceae bacterium]